MPDVELRAAEGCAPDPFLLWDSVWSPRDGHADWALSGADETLNRGGLRARSPLETAIVLALFTDRRIDPAHPLYYLCDGDPRGWWGDGIDVRADLGETAIGSHLWLLERAPLTIRGQPAERWAEQFAMEALEPLRAQGLVARIEVSAIRNETKSRLELTVRVFGRDGAAIFDRRFELYWNQVPR